MFPGRSASISIKRPSTSTRPIEASTNVPTKLYDQAHKDFCQLPLGSRSVVEKATASRAANGCCKTFPSNNSQGQQNAHTENLFMSDTTNTSASSASSLSHLISIVFISV